MYLSQHCLLVPKAMFFHQIDIQQLITSKFRYPILEYLKYKSNFSVISTSTFPYAFSSSVPEINLHF